MSRIANDAYLYPHRMLYGKRERHKQFGHISNYFTAQTECKRCHKEELCVMFQGHQPVCRQCCIDMGWLKVGQGKGEEWTVPLTKRTARGLLKSRLASALQRVRATALDKPDITMSYLMNLYIEQHGKCAVTGRKLTIGGLRRANRDTLSIDRINNQRGYVRGNVRLVTYQFNVAKQKFTDEELVEFCRAVVKWADDQKPTTEVTESDRQEPSDESPSNPVDANL